MKQFCQKWWQRWLEVRRQNRWWRWLSQTVLALLIVLVLAIIGFAIAIYGFKADGLVTQRAEDIFPYPVAMVNWSPIWYSDYNFTLNYTEHFYRASKQSYNQTNLENQILNQLIEQKISDQHATDDHISVSDSEVNQAYQQLVTKNGQDEVNKVLTDLYGLTSDQFKPLIYQQLLKQKLQTDLENKQQWYQVEVRHILIKVASNANQQTVDQYKQKALADLALIKSGQSFASVAKKDSEDTASKDQGGELGYISRGQTVQSFENAVFSAKKGDLLGPIRTQYGWELIQVENIRGNSDFVIWRSQSLVWIFR